MQGASERGLTLMAIECGKSSAELCVYLHASIKTIEFRRVVPMLFSKKPKTTDFETLL